MDFKKYYAFTDKKTIFSSIDFCKQRNRGCQKSNTVELDNFGFKEFTNKDYLDLAKSINPDFICTLTEQPRKEEKVGKKSSKRNVEKSS